MRAKTYLALLVSAVLAFGCATDKEALHNTELIRRYFDGWANRGDSSVADKLIATNLVLHSGSVVLNSLEEYKTSMSSFHKAFPDLSFTVEDQVAAGSKVAVRWIFRGTHLGEYQNRPPTGKAVVMTGTSTFRITDGTIQEIWVNMDRLALMQQLGWIPSAAEKK